MQICAQRMPPTIDDTECWLLDDSLQAADRKPLVRQEVSVADEA